MSFLFPNIVAECPKGPSQDRILFMIKIIIKSLFNEDNIFSASTDLTYGPHKTW